jgi:hypothetical protein
MVACRWQFLTVSRRRVLKKKKKKAYYGAFVLSWTGFKLCVTSSSWVVMKLKGSNETWTFQTTFAGVPS